jgi:hypothetical protein
MRIRIRVGNADPDPGEPNEQIIANPCGSGFVSKALLYYIFCLLPVSASTELPGYLGKSQGIL